MLVSNFPPHTKNKNKKQKMKNDLHQCTIQIGTCFPHNRIRLIKCIPTLAWAQKKDRETENIYKKFANILVLVGGEGLLASRVYRPFLA